MYLTRFEAQMQYQLRVDWAQPTRERNARLDDGTLADKSAQHTVKALYEREPDMHGRVDLWA